MAPLPVCVRNYLFGIKPGLMSGVQTLGNISLCQCSGTAARKDFFSNSASRELCWGLISQMFHRNESLC